MKNSKHNIVYKITNLKNGRIYVGVHKTNILYDGYMGSGKLIRRAINKEGVNNFKKEILFNYNTYKEAQLKEKEIVNEEFVKSDLTYNIALGGYGGDIFNKLDKNKQDKLRKAQSELCKSNEGIKSGQFQNLTKKQRKNIQAKVNETVKNMDKHFNCDKHRTTQTLINNARSRSKWYYIDAKGRKFETAIEASIENNISHKLAELRSRRGNCGWSRIKK